MIIFYCIVNVIYFKKWYLILLMSQFRFLTNIRMYFMHLISLYFIHAKHKPHFLLSYMYLNYVLIFLSYYEFVSLWCLFIIIIWFCLKSMHQNLNHTKTLHRNGIFIIHKHTLWFVLQQHCLQSCLLDIVLRTGSAPPSLESQLICSMTVWVLVNLNRFTRWWQLSRLCVLWKLCALSVISSLIDRMKCTIKKLFIR